MPSDAAMRAAKAIKDRGYFVDQLGRDAEPEWLDDIAEIIDREMLRASLQDARNAAARLEDSECLPE